MHPELELGLPHHDTLTECVIIDIDGVVCDSSARMARYIDGQALRDGDLAKFYASINEYGETTEGDIPIPAGQMLVEMCRQRFRGVKVVFLTSRDVGSYVPTLAWLKEHGLYKDGDCLLMQPMPKPDSNGKYTLHVPEDYKREETLRLMKMMFKIQLAVDDNTDVCKMYQSIGIPTLQARWPSIDCLTLVGDSRE